MAHEPPPARRRGLRDGVLAAAGTLNPAVGGPMVRTPLEPEVYDLIFSEGEPDGLWPVTPDAAPAHAPQPLPVREAQPASAAVGGVRPARYAVAVPGARGQHVRPAGARPSERPFLQAQSKAFAGRVLREAGADDGVRVDYAYRLALCRLPRPAERRSRAGLSPRTSGTVANPAGLANPHESAWADLCLALLNRNEFIYVP